MKFTLDIFFLEGLQSPLLVQPVQNRRDRSVRGHLYVLALQVGTVGADLLAVDHCRAAEIVDIGDVVPFIVARASIPWIEADLDVEWVASESKPAEFSI